MLLRTSSKRNRSVEEDEEKKEAILSITSYY